MQYYITVTNRKTIVSSLSTQDNLNISTQKKKIILFEIFKLFYIVFSDNNKVFIYIKIYLTCIKHTE